MFDATWSELLVIIIVALVVMGPKDLARLTRTATKWAGRARDMAHESDFELWLLILFGIAILALGAVLIIAR